MNKNVVPTKFAAGAALLLATGLMILPVSPRSGGSAAFAAPEPDPVPRRWQLTIEPGPLRIMSVSTPSQGERLYYYMTYKVTNTSGMDLLFTPSFDLATDEGDVLRSGRDVPADVTRFVLDALENPMLEDQISIVGMLLQGEENAKEGLAVWPVVSNHVRELEVYCNGFSGEMRAIDAFDPVSGGSKRVTLRKTLMLRFQPLGEARPMGAEGLPVVEKRWIMR
ncbi:MAG TPA: hypothetical protein VD971_12845 [Phycisphaerales bacterium]|nr:hypothetical protein [Phycisphaerales bacterium]